MSVNLVISVIHCKHGLAVQPDAGRVGILRRQTDVLVLAAVAERVDVRVWIVAGFLVAGPSATASSAVETGGTFPSCTVPRAPLESAEEVEVYELYNLGFADGLISLTKEVVVYGLYDLVLLDYAVVVDVVPVNQEVPGGPRISRI